MDGKSASDSLRALATSKRRSKVAQIRDLLADVEVALAAGATYEAVIETLQQHGLDITLGTFKSALKRLRDQNAKSAQSGHVPSPAKSTPSAATAPTSPAGLDTLTDNTAAESKPIDPPSSDPRDLDAIFRSVPDLAALSRIAKERRNKKP